MIKLGIVLFLVFIVYNLGSGCYYMLTDHGKTDRLVRALTWRIGLSIVLFSLIALGIYTGVIEPNTVMRKGG
jgi:apolipoprotein N-acyltransferase